MDVLFFFLFPQNNNLEFLIELGIIRNNDPWLDCPTSYSYKFTWQLFLKKFTKLFTKEKKKKNEVTSSLFNVERFWNKFFFEIKKDYENMLDTNYILCKI